MRNVHTIMTMHASYTGFYVISTMSTKSQHERYHLEFGVNIKFPYSWVRL